MDIFDTEAAFVNIVLLISATYFILVITIFCICLRFQPHRFIQSRRDEHRFDDGTSHAMPSSYLDCSCIVKCCPCPAFSCRPFLKSFCCDSGKLRRNVNCECIRPAIHGSQTSRGLNFVCC
uniref:Cysteine rich secreted protein n=1 Tax=Elaeophora elaphi TaxID=1147741 RepID=A0A158Q8K3_9BILA